jgi:SAM-dependent methyltransferase
VHKKLLPYLRCPANLSELRLQVIDTCIAHHSKEEVVQNGLLISDAGFIYPIINCIPRLLVEAVYDYKDFLQQHLPDYTTYLKHIQEKHGELLAHCASKNKKTKSSFGFEWSFLDTKKNDKLWHDDLQDLQQVLLKEFACTKDFFANKLALDAGCGHGLMTTELATLSGQSIGMELSLAVEQAYVRNTNPQAHFVQADVQLPPFALSTFDVLYSSGVLHHTNDTLLSLQKVSATLKQKGRISIWLYHPQKDWKHNVLQSMRAVFSKLPTKLSFTLILVFIFPFSFLIKKIKGKRKINAREEIIDLLDGFTPEHREEVPHDKAMQWLKDLHYRDIKIACQDQFGFSVVGEKIKILNNVPPLLFNHPAQHITHL